MSFTVISKFIQTAINLINTIKTSIMEKEVEKVMEKVVKKTTVKKAISVDGEVISSSDGVAFIGVDSITGPPTITVIGTSEELAVGSLYTVTKPEEPKSEDKTKVRKPVDYEKLGKNFLVEKAVHKLLLHNIQHKISTMLLGPTGVGKTELVTEIAKSLKLPVTIFDMGTMADPIMSLIGTHAITIEDGKSKSEFKASRFSEVIQQPGVVVLDELSRAAAGSNNLLFPCLDFRRELPMEYSFHDSTPIKIHPECVFIATANTGSSYTGTHKLDKALEDRFMILQIESLNENGCSYVLDSVYGSSLSDKSRNTIISIFFGINKEHDEFKISFRLSMRHLKTITMLHVNGFTIYDSFMAVCKGIGGNESIDVLKSIIKD